MRSISYTLISAMFLFSCGHRTAPDREQNNDRSGVDPRSIFKGNDRRSFKYDIPQKEVNVLLSSKLNGDWYVSSGELIIVGSIYSRGDIVTFYDSLHSTMTGWGNIIYNRSVNVIHGIYDGDMYDYYVDNNSDLVILKYNYRDDDMSLRERPEVIQQKAEIVKFENDRLTISSDGNVTELKRVIN